MNKIRFDRTSFDGAIISKQSLELWYDENNILTDKIKQRMAKIHRKQKKVDDLLREIENNIHDVLLLSPENLLKWVLKIDNNYSQVFTKYSKKSKRTVSTTLGKQVLKAFNYDYYRDNRLTDLAKKMNVKCCPYCNMHYTLYAEEDTKRPGKLAKFQFDHFFSKSKYPMLSMSLYNLIPSCAICNQGKSDKNLSLSFHPYHSDICKQFKFELDNPISLFSGEKINDHIDVNFVPTGSKQSELDDFVQTFHLKALYQRHGDVAQETFDKAYEYPYYSVPSNFKWLSNSSPEYIKRLWMGTYTKENEIEKRPLTKFIQDLEEQALRIKTPPEME